MWQQFVARNAGKAFQFVSVAVDNQGAAAARPWTERAGATFPTVIDRDNALAAIYDYKLIPNGIFLDAAPRSNFTRCPYNAGPSSTSGWPLRTLHARHGALRAQPTFDGSRRLIVGRPA